MNEERRSGQLVVLIREIEELSGRKGSGMTVLPDEPMSRHTTFHCGGPADVFLTVGSVSELEQVTGLCKEAEVPFYILGKGSNILVADSGIRGVVITLGGELAEIRRDGEHGTGTVEAGAGASLIALSAFARDNSLHGLEFAGGIPGSVGGGIIMNAGAYDGELKNIVTFVDVMDREGKHRRLSCEEMRFGYRTSRAKQEGLTVLKACFALEQGDRERIAARMEELMMLRRQKQPLEYPSAGSTFKRPEGYFAGKLIMDAGLSGYRVGDAQVSEKHCGFIINRGNASAAEIAELIEIVREKVYEDSGVMLEREVIYLGF